MRSPMRRWDARNHRIDKGLKSSWCLPTMLRPLGNWYLRDWHLRTLARYEYCSILLVISARRNRTWTVILC